MELEHPYDVLRIGHGNDTDDDTSEILRPLSGTISPTLVVSPDNMLWLRFTTDISQTMMGFSLQLNALQIEGKMYL